MTKLTDWLTDHFLTCDEEGLPVNQCCWPSWSFLPAGWIRRRDRAIKEHVDLYSNTCKDAIHSLPSVCSLCRSAKSLFQCRYITMPKRQQLCLSSIISYLQYIMISSFASILFNILWKHPFNYIKYWILISDHETPVIANSAQTNQYCKLDMVISLMLSWNRWCEMFKFKIKLWKTSAIFVKMCLKIDSQAV